MVMGRSLAMFGGLAQGMLLLNQPSLPAGLAVGSKIIKKKQGMLFLFFLLCTKAW